MKWLARIDYGIFLSLQWELIKERELQHFPARSSNLEKVYCWEGVRIYKKRRVMLSYQPNAGKSEMMI